MNVRRLAALDMHGRRGTARRRRLVLAEFILAALGGLALGGFVLAASSGVEAVVIGVWLAGVGANYAALAVHGLSFEGGEALRRALDGVDVERELRSYALRQLVLAIPFWVAGLAIGQA